MKLLFILLFFSFCAIAQPAKTKRQLVALVINAEPTKVKDRYILLTDKPASIVLQPGQTFVLRSAWQQTGDSVENIGEGTFNRLQEDLPILNAKVKDGKMVKQGDVAIFLVPLKQAGRDSIIFKLARFAINFTTVQDSSFYNRNTVLKQPSLFSVTRMAKAMAADIGLTATEMLRQNDGQDQEITSGSYKGQRLFAAMQKVTEKDVLPFLLYVYARPDKYMAHTFKVSEAFATWMVNGAPTIR